MVVFHGAIAGGTNAWYQGEMITTEPTIRKELFPLSIVEIGPILGLQGHAAGMVGLR